jgi:hypothetical protein
VKHVSPRQDTIARLLWVAVLGSVAWFIITVGESQRLAAPAAALFGLLYVGHAVYRIRNPRWLELPFWRDHRFLARVLGGQEFRVSGKVGRAENVFGALMQLILGAGMLVLAFFLAT